MSGAKEDSYFFFFPFSFSIGRSQLLMVQRLRNYVLYCVTELQVNS